MQFSNGDETKRYESATTPGPDSTNNAPMTRFNWQQVNQSVKVLSLLVDADHELRPPDFLTLGSLLCSLSCVVFGG